MELLINLANVLYVIAYFTLDMLRLRLLTTTAAVCLAVYFYSQPVPMLNVVAWNVVFILLNLSQIARLTVGRRGNNPTCPPGRQFQTRHRRLVGRSTERQV